MEQGQNLVGQTVFRDDGKGGVHLHNFSGVLADGFGNVFNASTLYEKIPEIWTQIEDTLAEIKNQK